MAITQPATPRETLDRHLAERILILDGAMGTMVHALKFSEADFRGEQFADHPKDLKNFIDVLVLTQPDGDRGDPPPVSRGRGRHHRDQHVRRDRASRWPIFSFRTACAS